MKIPKIDLEKGVLPLVIVDWTDAQTEIGPQFDIREAAQSSLCIAQSIGFLLRCDKRMVVIAHEFWPAENTCKYIEAIPRGIVNRIIELKPKHGW